MSLVNTEEGLLRSLFSPNMSATAVGGIHYDNIKQRLQRTIYYILKKLLTLVSERLKWAGETIKKGRKVFENRDASPKTPILSIIEEVVLGKAAHKSQMPPEDKLWRFHPNKKRKHNSCPRQKDNQRCGKERERELIVALIDHNNWLGQITASNGGWWKMGY